MTRLTINLNNIPDLGLDPSDEILVKSISVKLIGLLSGQIDFGLNGAVCVLPLIPC